LKTAATRRRSHVPLVTLITISVLVMATSVYHMVLPPSCSPARSLSEPRTRCLASFVDRTTVAVAPPNRSRVSVQVHGMLVSGNVDLAVDQGHLQHLIQQDLAVIIRVILSTSKWNVPLRQCTRSLQGIVYYASAPVGKEAL